MVMKEWTLGKALASVAKASPPPSGEQGGAGLTLAYRAALDRQPGYLVERAG